MKSGRLWFAVLCIVITFYGAMGIFAVIAPAAIIHSVTSDDWSVSFKPSVDEASRILRVPANRIKSGLFASFFKAIVMLISVVGLWRKLGWAQITLIILGIISAGSILSLICGEYLQLAYRHCCVASTTFSFGQP